MQLLRGLLPSPDDRSPHDLCVTFRDGLDHVSRGPYPSDLRRTARHPIGGAQNRAHARDCGHDDPNTPCEQEVARALEFGPVDAGPRLGSGREEPRRSIRAHIEHLEDAHHDERSPRCGLLERDPEYFGPRATLEARADESERPGNEPTPGLGAGAHLLAGTEEAGDNGCGDGVSEYEHSARRTTSDQIGGRRCGGTGGRDQEKSNQRERDGRPDHVPAAGPNRSPSYRHLQEPIRRDRDHEGDRRLFKSAKTRLQRRHLLEEQWGLYCARIL